MVGMDVSGQVASPVPESARVLVEIANSRELSVRPDLLGSLPGASALLRELSLLSGQERLSDASLEEVRRFRALLNLLLAADEAAKADTWQRLNELTQGVLLGVVFGPGTATLAEPPGSERPLARLVLHLYQALSEQTWQRIRLCANEECAAAFYDATRSRTQRWHSYSDCGNKSNVAAHRARSRAVRTN